MSEFDPYLKWLGIREKNLPINHYRLLGLDLFEDDPDVISMAADRQMDPRSHLSNGPHGEVSQQVLGELARARRCLLTADKKAEYDAELTATMSQSVAEIAPASPVPLSTPPVAEIIATSSDGRVYAPVVQPLFVPTSADAKRVAAATSDAEQPPTIGIRTDSNARVKSNQRESRLLAWSILGWISGGLAAIGIAVALIGSGVIGGAKPADTDDAAEVGRIDQPVKTSGPPTRVGEKVTSGVHPPDSRPAKIEPVKRAVIPIVETPVPPSKLFYPDPFESRFDLTNLALYPKSDPDHLGWFGEIKRGLEDKKTVPLEPSAPADRELIRVTPDAGAIVIGLALTTNRDLEISSVRPIFHDGFKAFAGNVIGSPTTDTSIAAGKDPIFAIAKPGFAVGEIEVSAVKPVRCVRVAFMKIGQQRLDPSNVYFSKWIGRETGPRRTIGNQNGLAVVGIYASLDPSGSLSTLSLVGVDPTGKPEVENLATLPKIELPKFFDPNKTASDMTDDGIDPFAVDPSDPNSAAKLSEPTTRERVAAKKNIPDSIQLAINNANDVPSRILAAETLIEAAAIQNEMLLTYVILKEAEALGVAAGDAQTAVDALRRIDHSFEIEFWKDVQKTIEKASRNLSTVTALNFKDTMDSLINEASGNAQFDAANKLLSIAIRLARRANDIASTNEYLDLEKKIEELEDLTNAGQKAQEVLSASPEDPAANLDQGDFLFTLKDDLGGALEHWSKSGNKSLVELVNLETRLDESKGIQIAELADAWRELGKSNRTIRDRKSLERSLDLYRQAGSLLSGLERQAVELKINELRAMTRD